MPPTKARIITALAIAASGLLALGASPARAAADPGAFTSVDPYRVLDTRNGIGATKTQVQPGASVTVQIAGTGGVPASGAGAVVLNVTVARGTKPGFVTAYPAGTTRPTAANLNFVAGQTIANHVTVGLGNGKVSLFNGSAGPVDLVADIGGWYRTGAGQSSGTFNPVTPTRLLDTRKSTPLGPNGTRAFQVAGKSPIQSSNVGAAALNLAVTRPAASGFLTAYPSGTDRPNASNVNFVRGQTISNAANVKVGSDGKIALFNGSAGTTDAVADVAGWFKSGTGSVAGAYNPVSPERILDTRNDIGTTGGTVPAGESVTLTVAGAGGVPDIGTDPAAGAAVLNVTVANAQAGGFLTAYPTGSPRPNASNINFTAGQTIPNLVTVKLGSGGKVNFFNGSGQDVDVIADIAGWYNAGLPPATFGNIWNSANWWLTLPVDADWKTSGEAAIIKHPALETFQDPAWFHMNDTADGIVFRANAGGATTSGSQYPRSELRELINGNQAAWSSTAGTHTMTVTQAITHLPTKKPQVVAGQIHDSSSDVIEIRLHGSTLYAWRDNQATSLVLDSNYTLGTKFKVQVRATATGVTVTYWKPDTAGAPTNTVTFPGLTGTGWYFKAGCYTQSNTTNGGSFDGDNFTAYGEVVIYDLDVTHS